jgi:hypothetical protein
MESGDIPLISANKHIPAHASPHRPSTASSAAHAVFTDAPSTKDFASGSSDADVNKYVSEYRILSVRQRVLEHELQDIQSQITQVICKMIVLSLQLLHFATIIYTG